MFARNVSNDIKQNTIVDSELQVKMMYAFLNKIQVPLAGLCDLETLIPKMNPGDKIFKYAESFNICGSIISSMISNIKLYYELKSDMYDDDESLFKVREEVSTIWKKFINKYTVDDICKISSEIKCELEVDTNIPNERVCINLNLFTRLLNNLLENSFLYTPQGYLKLSIYSSDENIMNIVITDSGEGIKKERKDDVFEPFTTFSSNGVGPGLGLPVCKEICKYFGGDIEILESGSGQQGTTIRAFFKYSVNCSRPTLPDFKFTLKDVKYKKYSEYNFQTEIKRTIKESKHKILVVEDSRITSKLITSFLRNDKFTVVPKFSGKEAIETCKDTIYDVILMDVNMPAMNGFTAINRIKQDCLLNLNTPIIIMSGTNIDDVGFLHHTNSAIHFLTKPIRKEILIRVLSRYTDPN